ncbi:MAG: D-glycero-alpha-D-manno-heptose-1,7-bisphosphate 7-phosphatase [Aureliella sp.]
MVSKAFFLDRDGTIIVDEGYPTDPGRIVFLKGAVETLQLARQRGFKLIVVSNQSGVGRGYFSERQMWSFHREFESLLLKAGIFLDKAYYCTAAPWDVSTRRKPSSGMLLEAAKEFDVDFSKSFMVGDKPSDIVAGKNVGCRTIFLGHNLSISADFECESWSDIKKVICR